MNWTCVCNGKQSFPLLVSEITDKLNLTVNARPVSYVIAFKFDVNLYFLQWPSLVLAYIRTAALVHAARAEANNSFGENPESFPPLSRGSSAKTTFPVGDVI
jgi:hypothetical protein